MRSEAASIGYRIAGIARWRRLLWLLAPFYVLAFGEVFLRVMAPVAIVPRYVTAAPYGVRVGMPNMRFYQTTPETRAQIRTNSRGIRADREFAYDKPPGTCRIVLLGDSMAVGYEVDLEDSFAYLLERGLRADGYRCELVNLAVSGFGTAEMLVTLREEGLKYHPDLVLMSVHATDPDDNVRSSLYALDAAGRLVRDKAQFLPGIAASDELSRHAAYRWVAENSQLYAALRERVAHAVKDALVGLHRPRSRQAGKEAAGAAVTAAVKGYPWRLTLRLMEEARQVTEAAGSRFGVIELPVSASRTQILRQLPEYPAGEEQVLHVLSPLAALRAAAAPDRKLYFEKGHAHLTPDGNRIVADYLRDEIESRDWLDPWKS